MIKIIKKDLFLGLWIFSTFSDVLWRHIFSFWLSLEHLFYFKI